MGFIAMKADAAIEVFRSFMDGDNDRAVSVMRQIAASEKWAGRERIANRIERLLNRSQMIQLPSAPLEVSCFRPERPLSSLVLCDDAVKSVQSVISEWVAKDRLREHGLEPRGVVLLKGPSGNGKTSLSQAIATELSLPFVLANYADMIDTHFGGTSKGVAKVMEFARRTPCVLMFDEADTIMSARIAGAPSEAAKEGNRIVNHLLMELDNTLRNSLVVFATNMAAELDSAFVRRLALTLELGPPDSKARHAMIQKLSQRWPFIAHGDWLAYVPAAESFAKIEQLAMDAARAHVLSLAG